MIKAVKSIVRRPVRRIMSAHRQKMLEHKLQTARLHDAPKVAVIGCGSISAIHVNSFDRSGRATVAAVCDRNPAALTRATAWPYVRVYTDAREMLRQVRPQIVAVCTWADSHAELVAMAAANGVHGIMCEKPLALQKRQMEEMIAMCDRHGVKLAGGHQYRFHANFVRAAEMVAIGVLGRIERVEGQIAGTLADNGPHLVDTVRFLLGDRSATRVSCRCIRHGDTFYQSVPCEQAAEGEIIFEGDVPFSFHTGQAATEFFQVHLIGSEATLTVSPDSIGADGPTVRPPRPGEGKYRIREFREFVEWVTGTRSSYQAGAQQVALSTELVLAAYESARLDRPVDLPLENDGDVIRQLYAAPPAQMPPSSTKLRGPRVATPGSDSEAQLAMQGGRRAIKQWFSRTPVMGRKEWTQLRRVIASRQLNCVGGTQTSALCREVAQAYDADKAVASTSGTAAVHVALAAVNPEPGDEVVVTPVTDMGSVIPVLACNCVPVFADVDPVTGNMTAETIAASISSKTRAVILVHLFGRAADLDAIVPMLSEKGVVLIEDCAQAHFAEYRGRKVGTFGQFGCFSLQQSKQITCGDGGITLVNRPEYVERAELFVDKGWARQYGRQHMFLGMNYRMTELQAAVARVQLQRLAGFIAKRRRTVATLYEMVRDLPGLQLPCDTPDSRSAWWVLPFRVDEEILGATTDELYAALVFEGMNINRHYLSCPVFELNVLKERNTYGKSQYPFSAVDCTPPDIRDFPGFREFHERTMMIIWSNRVRTKHARQIGEAFRKVMRAYMASDPVGGDVHPASRPTGTIAVEAAGA